MSKNKLLIFVSLILTALVLMWSSGDALAKRGAKPEPGKTVTINDVFKWFGKVTPSEQKAAAERAKQLGLKPGVAGRTAQSPVPGETR